MGWIIPGFGILLFSVIGLALLFADNPSALSVIWTGLKVVGVVWCIVMAILIVGVMLKVLTHGCFENGESVSCEPQPEG
jgi:hypothetical protein